MINRKLAYASDVDFIFKESFSLLKNLDFLVIDCLRYSKHPSHFNLDEVLELVKMISPKNTILTNMHNELDYKKLKKVLPKNVKPGYDGMCLNL